MNFSEVLYRPMKKGEEGIVSALIEDVFNEFVMPLYSREGTDEFLRYAQEDKIRARSQHNHFILVAQVGSHIKGAIEVREFNHISMLFIDDQYQRKGIGGNLIRVATSICQENSPELDQITVNSSPNAVQAYEKFGFLRSGSEQEISGIRFVPMVFKLPGGDGS